MFHFIKFVSNKDKIRSGFPPTSCQIPPTSGSSDWPKWYPHMAYIEFTINMYQCCMFLSLIFLNVVYIGSKNMPCCMSFSPSCRMSLILLSNSNSKENPRIQRSRVILVTLEGLQGWSNWRRVGEQTGGRRAGRPCVLPPPLIPTHNQPLSALCRRRSNLRWWLHV